MRLSSTALASLTIFAGLAIGGSAQAAGRGGAVVAAPVGEGTISARTVSPPFAYSGAPSYTGRLSGARHGGSVWQGYTQPVYGHGPRWSGRHDYGYGYGRHGRSRIIVAAGSDATNSRGLYEPPLAPNGHYVISVQPQIIYVTPPPRQTSGVKVVYGTQPYAPTAYGPGGRAKPTGRGKWRDPGGAVWQEY